MQIKYDIYQGLSSFLSEKSEMKVLMEKPINIVVIIWDKELSYFSAWLYGSEQLGIRLYQ